MSKNSGADLEAILAKGLPDWRMARANREQDRGDSRCREARSAPLP